jgi:hypothetical protein
LVNNNARREKGMQLIEKRATNRSNGSHGTPLIEIKHSFGTQKRSAYQIQEHDEKGLSFLVPKSDGYFMTNTPIQFNINNNGSSRANLSGTVKYYQPHYDNRGENYFKIGVKIQETHREILKAKFKLRTIRYSAENDSAPLISFSMQNNNYKFSLIDVSKYSAAFYCDEKSIINLTAGSSLNKVRILSGETILFDGTAKITQAYRDNQGRNRAIIEPEYQLINADILEKNEVLKSILNETHDLFEQSSSYKKIDNDFKSAIADLRVFLEELKNYLETPKIKTCLEKTPELLEDIYNCFYPEMDKKIKHIDILINELALSEEENSSYKQYYQKHLLPLFMLSPFNHRIYFKPAGYPGDYEMINMVHRNNLEGEDPLGKLINKYSSSIPIAQAVRKRTEFFTNEVKDLSLKNKKVKVLSIASGPALEFNLLLKKYPQLTDNVSITLLDHDIDALRFSQEKLYETRIKTKSKIKIDFVHQNVGNYLRELSRNKVSENFDIVYASGLFDYFDFKTSKFVIKHLLKQTRPGGKIIIANLSQDGHDHKIFMEYGNEWYLTYRSREDMVKLSEAIPAETKFNLKEIENGICKFIEIEC